eukprot:4362595-Amphidinium_carterae.2
MASKTGPKGASTAVKRCHKPRRAPPAMTTPRKGAIRQYGSWKQRPKYRTTYLTHCTVDVWSR